MHAVASSTQFSIMFPSRSILCGRRRNYREYLTHCLSYLRHAIENLYANGSAAFLYAYNDYSLTLW